MRPCALPDTTRDLLARPESRPPTGRHATLCEQGANPHSFAPTLAVDMTGTDVESATVCAFSPRPIPFWRFVVLDKALFFMCCKARRSHAGRSGQGSTARRRSGGLVPRWRSKQKWLPATSVRRQLPSATATPELGLARTDDARPLAASQPFFVSRAEACSPLLFRPPIFQPTFFSGLFNLIPPRELTRQSSAQPQYWKQSLHQMIFSFVGPCEHPSSCQD